MTARELEDLIGCKIPKAWLFLVHHERLFRRELDGTWTEYR